ncbi:NADP-dependent oxidoreductase [Haloactinomyces albus]|uniref:NADPH-dependent curcumin reductase CurA n=1 Tax=Haloactinomyces albus TaxID=1352928 RepID=A0AAE3ZD46_9ACTN|nr:NADP-dependent oxidoreductase [Haloactinomyces albus]MDR7301463.1 NADPH-dependent curcumin reductase CurA [Haloactinomyces albus]
MADKAVPEQALEVRLASRPNGWPTRENFDLVEAPVPEPGDGQILVRNKVMSVDPAMRGRMNNAKSYVPPFEIDKPLSGGAVGEVVVSNSRHFSAGQTVLHQLGWREYATVGESHAVAVAEENAPLGAYLGVLGMPGLTAYVGLFDIASFQQGDTVFVSGAAGAVGSVVGQLAKLHGATRVIGSAGSPEKVRSLTEDLGFDAAFNYKDAPVAEQLKTAAPDGIDVYFDNVGGDHLEAAIGSLNEFGRIAACGAVSQYNATEPQPGPRNMFQFVTKRLSMRGFIVIDHADRRDRFFSDVGPLVRDGKLRYEETTVEGLRNAPDAFLGMLRGENTGKMLVTV